MIHSIVNGSRRKVICFGVGYSAKRLLQNLINNGWEVSGTCRTSESAKFLDAIGIEPLIFYRNQFSSELKSKIDQATHFIVSIPPDYLGDPVLNVFKNEILCNAKSIQWIGYFSSTGVYGDHNGAWVDERSATKTVNEHGLQRLNAEREWLALYENYSLPVHIFRIAGIYGPQRNPLDQARIGKAQRIFKEDFVFSRIHVDDIANAVGCSIAKPSPGSIYNLADDEPAPYHEVIEYAYRLLNMKIPPLTPIEKADISPIQRGFFSESRKINNLKIKKELKVKLKYPDFRKGLKCLIN